jgi:hypothetical protein
MGFKWRFSQIRGLIEQTLWTKSSILEVEKFVIIFELGHQTVRNTPTGVRITPVFGPRDGPTRA